MIYRTRITILCIAILLSLSLAASADPVTDLKKFENNTAANADEVNANFNNVKKAVDDNYERILNFSAPRSVTYSAMGFSPGAAIATPGVTGYVAEFETEFNKNPKDGSLSLVNDASGTFYHSMTLPSGVIITRMHARVSGAVKVSLEKVGEANSLAEITGTGGDPHNVESDSLEHTIEGFPASYFIEVTLSNKTQHLFSVAIEYAYPEP